MVIVNDVPQLPTAIQNKLNDYARSGHGVWFILGRNTERLPPRSHRKQRLEVEGGPGQPRRGRRDLHAGSGTPFWTASPPVESALRSPGWNFRSLMSTLGTGLSSYAGTPECSELPIQDTSGPGQK